MYPDALSYEVIDCDAFLGVDNQLAGSVTMMDEIREEAVATVTALRMMGIQTSMLSGDKQAAAEAVAAKVGIPKDQVSFIPSYAYS